MCKDRYSVLSHALIIMEYDVATHKKGKNKRSTEQVWEMGRDPIFRDVRAEQQVRVGP